MRTSIGLALLLACGAPAASAQCFEPSSALFSSQAKPSDHLGTSLALSGDTFVAGAPDAEFGLVKWAGAAVVFERAPGGGWSETVRLEVSDGEISDHFGAAVALEGDLAVVGAPGRSSKACFVFDRDQGGAGAWGERLQLLPKDGAVGLDFGSAVAISGDRIAVGADSSVLSSQNGVVYVYERDHGGVGNWGQSGRIEVIEFQPKTTFGAALILRGDEVLVGEPGGGEAWLFARDQGGPNQWGLVARLGSPVVGASGFGSTVALWGDTAAVGEDGGVHVFERDQGGPGAFGHTHTVAPLSGSLGSGLDLALWGDSLVVGNPIAGHALRFERNLGSAWGQAETFDWVIGKNQHFGSAVELEGHRIVVGAERDHLGVPWVTGLARDVNTGTLYAVNLITGVLGTIDVGAGQSTVIGDLAFDAVQGLAFDPLAGVLYGVDATTDQLIVIDTATADANAVGPIGIDKIAGLAFDPVTGRLYGSQSLTSGPDLLVSIDVATGAGTGIGDLGFAQVAGLTVEPVTGKLYGMNRNPSNSLSTLLEIDTVTGAATAIATLPGRDVRNLSFGAGGNLSGVDLSDVLLNIDPELGTFAIVGKTAKQQAGAAFVSDRTDPESYCTAGMTTNGCTASISAAGSPSAAFPVGFQVTVAEVEGVKQGLIYFGTSGPKATPWVAGSGASTSFLCVNGPHTRTPVQGSGGTPGQCDGVLALDFNAWMAAHPLKAPPAGSTVWMQGWFRDPPAQKGTHLSDGLRFLLCP